MIKSVLSRHVLSQLQSCVRKCLLLAPPPTNKTTNEEDWVGRHTPSHRPSGFLQKPRLPYAFASRHALALSMLPAGKFHQKKWRATSSAGRKPLPAVWCVDRTAVRLCRSDSTCCSALPKTVDFQGEATIHSFSRRVCRRLWAHPRCGQPAGPGSRAIKGVRISDRRDKIYAIRLQLPTTTQLNLRSKSK